MAQCPHNDFTMACLVELLNTIGRATAHKPLHPQGRKGVPLKVAVNPGGPSFEKGAKGYGVVKK